MGFTYVRTVHATLTHLGQVLKALVMWVFSKGTPVVYVHTYICTYGVRIYVHIYEVASKFRNQCLFGLVNTGHIAMPTSPRGGQHLVYVCTHNVWRNVEWWLLLFRSGISKLCFSLQKWKCCYAYSLALALCVKFKIRTYTQLPTTYVCK